MFGVSLFRPSLPRGRFRGARISSLPTVKLVYKAKYVTAGIASIKLNNI